VLLMTVIGLLLGSLAYGVTVRTSTLPGLVLTLLLGTAAFTTLGIGITRYIRSAESAPIVINLAVWPLTFISGIWFPITGMPKWLKDIADFFPIHALADGLEYAFNPYTTGAGIKGADIRNLIIWLAVGIWLMLRFLRHPQGD
jgi:ABC-2 type transport system permease protein